MDYKNIARKSLIAALYYCGTPWREGGISAAIDTWYVKKGHFLHSLEKHENWNPKELAIIGGFNEVKPPVPSLARRNLSWLLSLLRRQDVDVSFLETHAVDMLMQKNILKADVDALGDAINDWPVKPSAGMKSSRFILKTAEALGFDITKCNEARSYFNTYSEAISPYTRRLTYSLSLNPGDYINMSNGNSWSSCHSLRSDERPGGWCAGTISYMQDPSSLVFTLVAENIRYEDGELCLVPKVYRQMLFVSPDGRRFVQSRAYPDASPALNREIRRVVHEILSSVHGFENKWAAPHRSEHTIIDTVTSYHYQDYYHYPRTCATSVVLEDKEDLKEGLLDDEITVGSRPKCIACGEYEVWNEARVHCGPCSDDHSDYYREDDW